jgi:hypothetical protein
MLKLVVWLAREPNHTTSLRGVSRGFRPGHLTQIAAWRNSPFTFQLLWQMIR